MRSSATTTVRRGRGRSVMCCGRRWQEREERPLVLAKHGKAETARCARFHPAQPGTDCDSTILSLSLHRQSQSRSCRTFSLPCRAYPARRYHTRRPSCPHPHRQSPALSVYLRRFTLPALRSGPAKGCWPTSTHPSACASPTSPSSSGLPADGAPSLSPHSSPTPSLALSPFLLPNPTCATPPPAENVITPSRSFPRAPKSLARRSYAMPSSPSLPIAEP